MIEDTATILQDAQTEQISQANQVSQPVQKEMQVFDGTIEELCLNFYWDNIRKSLGDERADTFVRALQSGTHRCYFQRAQPDKSGGKNKEGDKSTTAGKPCYTMFVCLDDELCMRMRLVLNTEVKDYQPYYHMFVPEVRMVTRPPRTDVLCADCTIQSANRGENSRLDDTLGRALGMIDALPLPQAEVDAARDKQIWDTYLRALDMLVHQKVRIWKISSISKNIFRSAKLADDNAPLLTMTIEQDNPAMLKQDVSDLFQGDGLKPVYAMEEVAYVKFEGEHRLSDTERDELINIAECYAYKLKENSPELLLQCRLNMKGEQLNDRKTVLQKVLNSLRAANHSHLQYKADDQCRKVSVNYRFADTDQRERFVADMRCACDRQQGKVQLQWPDGELGVTQYTFLRNEAQRETQEKNLRTMLLNEQFVFYNQTEYDRYMKERAYKGIGIRGPEGKEIGTLVDMNGERLTFRLTEDFLQLFDDLGPKKLIENGGYIRSIFPGEIANIMRMRRAMNKVVRPDVEGYPANWNLANFIFDPESVREPQEDIEHVKQRISANLIEPRLLDQPKQLEAVAKALAAQDIAIIQGPPGTGKTTVIAEIIWQTLCANPSARVLITSQTNLAVDNAIARLVGKKNVFPIRVGKIERFEEEGKQYAYSRLKQWREAETGSAAEKEHEDNIVKHWIDNVASHVTDEPSLAPALSSWKEALNSCTDFVKQLFVAAYVQQINVFGATCSESGSPNFYSLYAEIFNDGGDEAVEPVFDLVIMDEASKAIPPELILPLTLGKKMVVIGDHKQLPPMIDSEDFAEAMEEVGAKQLVEELSAKELRISQFERLFRHAPAFTKTSLDTQFRMHEQIMNCISQFYSDQPELANGLMCGISETQDKADLAHKGSRYHGLRNQPLITPDDHVIWVEVNTPEQQHEGSHSFYNTGEVEAVQTVLRALTHAEGFREYDAYMQSLGKEEEREIGVITYYAAQMNELKRALTAERLPVPLRINTVDKFQGMERNIVIVSTVRSTTTVRGNNKPQPNDKYPDALGFAKELQRVNVGFSRARRLLIVVGNRQHFAHKKEYKQAIRQMKCLDISQLQNL